MTSGYPRIQCCVPGCCRGTTGIEPIPDGYVDHDTGCSRREFICQRHWRLIPRAWKRRRRLFARATDKAWPDGMSWNELTAAQQNKYRIASGLARKMWRRMKQRAADPMDGIPIDAELEEIERRFGIA